MLGNNPKPLKAFFSYFGSKVGASGKYPPPAHDTIIEPFAGSAGYAGRYYYKDVQLYDLSPTICGVWEFLIRATQADVLALPLEFDDVNKLTQAERGFIGFWWARSVSSPSRNPTPWMKTGLYMESFWSERTRLRIANQVELINHWSIENIPYNQIKPVRATWFVDPPYQKEGHKYPYGSKRIDYADLGAWVKERPGQIIACESSPAAWLPFVPFFKNNRINCRKDGQHTQEMLYTAANE